jgi:hypothetical protein
VRSPIPSVIFVMMSKTFQQSNLQQTQQCVQWNDEQRKERAGQEHSLCMMNEKMKSNREQLIMKSFLRSHTRRFQSKKNSLFFCF